MAQRPDLSAFDKVRSIADYDKAAIEEARQRYMQAQGLQMQKQQQDLLQQKFEQDKAEFEANKAAQAAGLFTGNSIQAQIGNQMSKLGYSPEQIVEALTMKGIPLQDGGYATYSPPTMVGRPSASQQPPEPLAGPPSQTAPRMTGDMGAKNEQLPLPNPDELAQQMQGMIGRVSPGVRTIVEPGMKITEQRDMANNLAKTEQQASNALDIINSLIDEQGNLKPEAQGSVGGIGGIEGRIAEYMPVTENQRRTQPFIDQLKGQAFLTAFEQLKGGGQITEVEGRKATEAIIRLQQYQSEEDFAKALKDLRDVVNSGLQRARNLNTQFGNQSSVNEQPQQQAGQPQIGAIDNGYVYLGGDPSNPQSWKKVQ